jgi:hypothetical protein
MNSLKTSSLNWSRTLHHKTLARSIGAIAGLTGALSVLVGTLAARMTPHGWSSVKVALHLSHKPLILKLAPFIAGFAVAAAAAAGLLSFYSWYREGREARENGVKAGAGGSAGADVGTTAGADVAARISVAGGVGIAAGVSAGAGVAAEDASAP